MNIQLLVLDMAGTTIDENNVVYKTLTKAVNKHGYAVNLEKVLEICAGMEKEQAIRNLLESIDGNVAHTKEIFKCFSDDLIQAYEQLEVKPIAGVEKFLIKTRSLGKKIVLNTGYTARIAQQLLSKLHWQKDIHFDGIITADDVSKSRPSPEMIKLAMDQFSITDAQQVLKAGDSVVDIQEGKNAGCGLTVAVLSGAQTRDQLEVAKPDYILDNLSKIEKLII